MPMIAALLALQAIQAQPIVRIAPPATATELPKQRLSASKQESLAEARELLGRAELLSASYRPAPGAPSKAELDLSVSRMKVEMNSVAELGDVQSVRLQAALDRLSKLMTAVSNIMKKYHDTQQSVVNNIK